jgi:hypothetical protein
MDHDIRKLQRLAEQGDFDAMKKLHLEQLRRGMPITPDILEDTRSGHEPWFIFPNVNITAYLSSASPDEEPHQIVFQGYKQVEERGSRGENIIFDGYLGSEYLLVRGAVFHLSDPFWEHEAVQERLRDILISGRSLDRWIR